MQTRSQPSAKISTSFITLQEGFQQFGHDLNKLQQFVEVNNTAFSKILKKWDKMTKSRTKELYLSRAVEVQPCFNRDVISELSDQATTSLLELGAWAEGENIHYESGKVATTVDGNDADSHLQQALQQGNLEVLHEWLTKLRDSPSPNKRITKTFLHSIATASESSLATMISSGLIDWNAVDEINERNCLHEAAVAGRPAVLEAALQAGADPSHLDVYGRLPLHYACINGQVEMVARLATRVHIDQLDHDNFTPLLHAITRRQLACAAKLLDLGARVDPQGECDHGPLNLACQYGCAAIVRLLLERKAKILPDAEGLYPQHLVARVGNCPSLLLALEESGADLNQRDKLYQWTPLVHAAAEGQVACLQVLLGRHVDTGILDEKGCSALYYAAWEGHLDCMKLLARRPSQLPQRQVTNAAEVPEIDVDGIPELELPPPIIPLRRYGHNFLDNKIFLQMSLETIAFYNDSKYPAARLTISSRSPDVIPRNIMLPISDDSRLCTFQVAGLTTFDFDLYPVFGSKIIARTVALPELFTSDAGHCCLPLYDPRIRAIGHVSFRYQIVRPLVGAAFDMTHFATYWRATSHMDAYPSGFITGSSLSGDYVRLFVQLTRDAVPVLHPRWHVLIAGVDVPVSQLSGAQFEALVGAKDEVMRKLQDGNLVNVHRVLASSFLTLDQALRYLPRHVHVAIQVLYPPTASSSNVNDTADVILAKIFEQTRTDSTRAVVLASHNADICTALNWKQPNCKKIVVTDILLTVDPVLFCNDLGTYAEISDIDKATVPYDGHHAISVKEAVQVAKSNNFMGIVCNSNLLVSACVKQNGAKSSGRGPGAHRNHQGGRPGPRHRHLHCCAGIVRKHRWVDSEHGDLAIQ